MASFDEYAALARQLHELQRSDERTAAAADQRRGALAAAVDQLGRRLAAQQQRLRQLAQAIGEPPPSAAPPAPPMPAPPPGPPPGLVTGAEHDALPPGPPHPQLPPGPARLALPVTPTPDPGPWSGPVSGAWPAPDGPSRRLGGVPTPSAPAPGLGAAVPGPRTPPVDPEHELELARRAADAADEAALRAEAEAGQPPLLPGWSPLARAAAIYAGCALVAVLGEYLLVVAASTDAVDTFSLFAWICGGLPAVAFFVAYLILSVWGKPRVVTGAPARYARLGFAICFAAMPAAYCGFSLLTSLV